MSSGIAPGGARPPLLEVDALRFGPGGRALAEPLSFSLEAGHCLVLLGPNGAGKTSLLRTLIGALPPVDGQVRWGGRALAELTERERAAQVAFAAPRTPDAADFTVEHLVLVGRVAARGLFAAPTAADRGQVDRALAQLGLERLDIVQTVIERRATFACTAALERPAQQVLPGCASLLACADYVAGPYPATLEGAVRSGQAAADALA